MIKKLINDRKTNKILQKIVKKVVFFDNKRRKDLINRLKKTMLNSLIRELSAKYPDDYIIFTRNGAGDIFFAASLLNEFKKRNPGKIIYITEFQKLKDFIQAFPGIDEVVVEPDSLLLQDFAPYQKPLKKGQINFLFFPYRGGNKNQVFADSYANLLGLDVNTPRQLPQISESNLQNARQEFERLQIKPDKTIMLIPEAVMFDYRVLDTTFWKNLAKILTRSGYDVIFNSANKAYKDYKTTFLPLLDFIAFTKQINHTIAFRSGICDVLAGMGINKITAIYPPNFEVIWATNKFAFDNVLNKYHERPFDTEFENVFNIYSLNSNFKTDQINELIFNYNENKLTEEILNKLTERTETTKIKEWI